MDFTRFEALLQRWEDGDATPEEIREFESLLRSDAAFRKELAHSVLLEAGLHRRFAAAKAAGAAPPATRPLWRKRSWEAAAALIVLAVSLFAVGRLLLRSEEPAHRVLSGEVWTPGAPANVLLDGQSFEVRGLAPATVQLKDGTRAVLDAGSAGSIPAAGPGFELRKGSASFTVETAFRVTTPVGSITVTNGQFWILLRPTTRKLPKELARRPELIVETTRGAVDVDAWDTRASVAAGQRRLFGAPLPPGGTDYARLLDRVALSLSAAIARATAAAPGVPVHAELEEENGRLAYSIGLVAHGKTRELAIDPKNGQVLEEEADDDDRRAVAAAVTLPLASIVDRVLESVPGRAVEAEFELKGGRLRAEIRILGPEGLKEIKADPATGEILKSESKGASR
jgi:uncharacterized membrane protein YkoI